MTTRQILWERSDAPGHEWCELTAPSRDAPPSRVAGVAVMAWEGDPWRVEYEIELDDAGRTRHVTVTARGGSPGSGPVSLDLTADGAGTWLLDDRPIISAPGALDIDLGFSPSTNTLPIRRLGLAVGERSEIAVAWVLFPSFEVVLGRQSYERLADRTFRYRSAGFEADLTVDEDGLVDAYHEWRAIARS